MDIRHILRSRIRACRSHSTLLWSSLAGAACLAVGLSGCSSSRDSRAEANDHAATTVGVTKVVKKTLSRQITLSSELVPFEEIDVFAKESGYVNKLNVDYGSRVRQGQVMATLEIPELEAQLQQDQAEIKAAKGQVDRAAHELGRYQAQYKSLHLEYTRLNDVFETQPGIVAQQEVDDAQGRDLAAASQVDAGKAALEAAQSQLAGANARLVRDQTLFGYSRITAPFSGVVTQRYANLGALVQGRHQFEYPGLPIVRLSQDDLFRLVIPIPESYVRYIRGGDPVTVRVPSLNRSFPGKGPGSRSMSAKTPAPCTPRSTSRILSMSCCPACMPKLRSRLNIATTFPRFPWWAWSGSWSTTRGTCRWKKPYSKPRQATRTYLVGISPAGTGLASMASGSFEAWLGNGRYPLRVRRRNFFARSGMSFTVMVRQPMFGLGWG